MCAHACLRLDTLFSSSHRQWKALFKAFGKYLAKPVNQCVTFHPLIPQSFCAIRLDATVADNGFKSICIVAEPNSNFWGVPLVITCCSDVSKGRYTMIRFILASFCRVSKRLTKETYHVVLRAGSNGHSHAEF